MFETRWLRYIVLVIGKYRLLKTLRFEQPDRPTHFEVLFELEKETFGLEFPDRGTWACCSAAGKDG